MARFYVYALVNPSTHKPFYIGKGSQLRTLHHFAKEKEDKDKVIVGVRTEDIEAEDQAGDAVRDDVGTHEPTRKQSLISKLKSEGKGHADIARIVMQDLDESIAFDVESFLITSCYPTSANDMDCLLNIQSGHHTERFRPYAEWQLGHWPLIDKFDLFEGTGGRVRDEAPDYYVYALVDPESGLPFYIGKGKAGRLFHHFEDAKQIDLTADDDSEKLQHLREVLVAGHQESKIGRILARGLSEDSAFAIEALLIRFFYGFSNLTNQVDGNHGIRVRPKPNGEWTPLDGFDHPHVVDPDSPQDRQWLQDQLTADGIHLPLEQVCKRLAPQLFDPVRILDAGGLAREGDVISGGRVLTRLKVFIRRKRIQVEARPRSSKQRAWMFERFEQAGYPGALRLDGVFIPSIWRGARNMTSDVGEAVRRARVILEILTQPITDQFRKLYGQYLRGQDVQERPPEALQESPDGGHDLSESSATGTSIRNVQAPEPLSLVQRAPKAAKSKFKKGDPVRTEARDCVARLEEVSGLFEDLEFLGPYPASSGNRIYVKALCPMADGYIWLLIYCGSMGFQCELRGYKTTEHLRLENHLRRLGVQTGRKDHVFKFQNCDVTKDIGVIYYRICMLLQFALADTPEGLIGIPPEYFLVVPDAVNDDA